MTFSDFYIHSASIALLWWYNIHGFMSTEAMKHLYLLFILKCKLLTKACRQKDTMDGKILRKFKWRFFFFFSFCSICKRNWPIIIYLIQEMQDSKSEIWILQVVKGCLNTTLKLRSGNPKQICPDISNGFHSYFLLPSARNMVCLQGRVTSKMAFKIGSKKFYFKNTQCSTSCFFPSKNKVYQSSVPEHLQVLGQKLSQNNWETSNAFHQY